MIWWTLLGFAVASAEAVPTLVQAAHSKREDSVAGVSSVTHTAWLFSWVVWLWYGVLIAEGPVVLQNGVGFLGALWMFHLLRRIRGVSPMVVASLAISHVAVAAIMWGSPELGAAILTGGDVLFLIPQIRAAWRAHDVSGISHFSYRFSILMDVLWIAYAVGVGHPFAASWSVVSLGFAGAVLIGLKVGRIGRGQRTEHAGRADVAEP